MLIAYNDIKPLNGDDFIKHKVRFRKAVRLLGLIKNGAHYSLHLYVSHLYRIFSSRLANAAFRRYLVFGKAFFDKYGAGRTASILDYNHDLLNLLKKLLELISETSIVGIYLIVMVVISWKLTLVSLLVFPAMHFIRQWIARKSSKVLPMTSGRWSHL